MIYCSLCIFNPLGNVFRLRGLVGRERTRERDYQPYPLPWRPAFFPLYSQELLFFLYPPIPLECSSAAQREREVKAVSDSMATSFISTVVIGITIHSVHPTCWSGVSPAWHTHREGERVKLYLPLWPLATSFIWTVVIAYRNYYSFCTSNMLEWCFACVVQRERESIFQPPNFFF
ncbi:hypothetical protein KP509_27G028600 [Ceratopteris richardii]|uniref:Uncharacterized protein n=1 Tax=Ceratopteris richardii TaxID=49495 RepID=A0A8T2REV1_CERRI|nr:hypothetical protein KP509_27G028600 [Ceratopteris richardii]